MLATFQINIQINVKEESINFINKVQNEENFENLLVKDLNEMK